MIKSNIVGIGEAFFNNSQKLIRMYEKITEVKVESKFKYLETLFMDSKQINNENKLHKYYKHFEKGILDGKFLSIFCFDSFDDFEKFDLNGILKENAIIIDKIDEEDYGMTAWELWTYCNKEHNVNNKGDHKVILVDMSNGKEYMIGEFEPKRTIVKETDKTIEFSIYPIKTERVKDVGKITVSEFVKSKLEECKRSPNWLAKEMNISASSIYGKLDRDSFNAYDLLKIAKLFNISFEELLEKVELI